CITQLPTTSTLFPTRRSSDLHASVARREEPCPTHEGPVLDARDDPGVCSRAARAVGRGRRRAPAARRVLPHARRVRESDIPRVSDRKSTRLNSSHLVTSYAVF